MLDKGQVKLVVNATDLNLEEAAAQDDKEFKESDLEQTAFVLVLARDSDFAEAENSVFICNVEGDFQLPDG